MATQIMSKVDSRNPQVAISREGDWTKPRAMAIPKEGYFTPELHAFAPPDEFFVLGPRALAFGDIPCEEHDDGVQVRVYSR